MADVFLTVAEGLGGFAKLQVIKRLKPEMQDDAEMLGMFLDEARLAARLNHPNVVQTNEVGEVDGRYFIAMEYLEGQSLHRLLHEHLKRRKEPLPLRLHLRVIADFLPGLRYAHGLKNFDGTPLHLVHRDISPHNVMVTYEGMPKIVDFGIAKAATNANATRLGVFKGKIGYSAPEQVKSAHVDERTDLYSVGVLIWEAVAGRRMWKGTNEVTILQRVLAGELPALRAAKEDAPAELVRIAERALSADPASRHPNAGALKEELEAYITATWGKVLSEEVGEVVSELFQADRARVRDTVEQKIAEFQANPHGPIAIVNMADEAPSSLGSDPSHRGTGSSPSAARRIVTTPSGAAAPISASGQHLAPITTTAASPLQPAPAPSRLPVVLGVLAVAALGTAAALFARTTPAPVVAAVVGTSVAATAPPAAAPTAVPTVAAAPPIALAIAVSPAHARIFLDDKKMPGNPYEARLPADAQSHQIRAEAEGFASTIETITFEHDAKIQLTLRPKVAGAARPAAADALPDLAPKKADQPKPQLDAIP
jgi:serine/threonine-protein kinase